MVIAYLKDGFQKIERMLFRQIHPASFVIVRILMGLLCIEEAVNQQGLSDEEYLHYKRIEPKLVFHYRGFDWIPRVDDIVTWKVILTLSAVSGAGIMLGCLYRLSTIVFAVTFTFTYLSEASYYLNHLYLFVCLSWIFTLTEGNMYFAIDPYIGLAKHSPTISAYNIYVFRLLMSAVYIYAAIAKMNYDWMVLAIPLTHWLPKRIGKFEGEIPDSLSDMFDNLMDSKFAAHFMSVTGMLYDLLIPALFSAGGLWRNLGFGLTCIFHITNKIIFRIGIFPYLSLALATVYFEFDWPVRVWNATLGRLLVIIRMSITGNKRETKKSSKLQQKCSDSGKPGEDLGPGKQDAVFVSSFKTKLMTVTLLLISSHQLLYPLRHHLYPGDVTWNELGHRYSWRMKLRDKVGTVKCGRELPNGSIQEIPSYLLLTDKQERTIAGRPEMVEEFSHALSKHFKDLAGDGQHYPIFCLSLASVNFRMPQFLLDPRVDLAGTPLWSTTAEFFVDFLPRDVTKDHPFVPPVEFDETRIDRRRVRDMFQNYSIEDGRNHFRELERLGIIGKPMQRGGVKVVNHEAALGWRRRSKESVEADALKEEL